MRATTPAPEVSRSTRRTKRPSTRRFRSAGAAAPCRGFDPGRPNEHSGLPGLLMKGQRKRYRVLMVEDSRLSLEVYAQRLERRGYVVATATSAEEARVRLDEAQPDI